MLNPSDDVSFDTGDERLDKILKNLRDSKTHLDKWRIEAREAERFFAGDQWSEEDRQKLLQEGRPAIVFNKMVKIINSIAGIEIQNRQEVKYRPTEPNDDYFAEAMTQAAKYVRARCDADDEESQSFTDVLKVGIGWTETRISYDVDLDGQIIIERVDPFEMLYDPYAIKQNLADARWVCRVREMGYDEFKSIWPDVEPEGGDFWKEHLIEPSNNIQGDEYKYGRDDFSVQMPSNRFAVIQYQYYDLETVYRYTDIDGEIKEATEDEFKKIKEIIEVQGIRYVKQKRRHYKQMWINGTQILEEGDCPSPHYFTIVPITGIRDSINNIWFGLSRLLLDPQRWSNKWLSQVLHILNTNAKGGIMFESGVFKDQRAAKDLWSRPDSFIEVRPGGLDRIKDKTSPPYPEGVDRLMQYANQSMLDVTGLNEEVLGMANRDQAGVLEYQRIKTVYTTFSVFFNALRRYRKMQGRVLAEFIREFLAQEGSGRILRILGDGNDQFISLISDKLSVSYDVIVDESPTSPNAKERNFQLMMQLLPITMAAGVMPPPDVLDYLPLPFGLASKWKEQLQAQQNNPVQQQMQEIDMMLQQLRVEEKQVGVEKTSSEINLNYARADKEKAMAQEHLSASNESDMLAHQMYLDEREQARKDLTFALEQKRKRLESAVKLMKEMGYAA